MTEGRKRNSRLYVGLAVAAAAASLVYGWKMERVVAMRNAAFRTDACGHHMSAAEVQRGVEQWHERYDWGYAADSFADMVCYQRTTPLRATG